MGFSVSNPAKLTHTYNQQAFSSLQSNRVVQVDSEQMFQLIDGILPFEACLYHQVLPLSLRGTQLKLGMVNPADTSALDYVRRILAYMNCSLATQPLSAEEHQAALSAYLSHTGQATNRESGSSAAKPRDPVNRNDRATLIVDSPEELEEREMDSLVSSQPFSAPSNPTQSQPVELPSHKATGKPTVESSAHLPTAPSSGLNLPVLEVKARYLSSSVDVLATLPPQQLLQELLGRILAGGIGRLYFERHPDRGRILWSQNGVLQSVLEGLPPSVFQGVINELKRLTHMSMISVERPKQVEIERLYHQNRILLRLRVMPGHHGEEATLQVLRGAALKFYQQQQLENLSRDALTMAQQLQQKVNEIRERTQGNPTLTASQLDALPALDEVLRSVDEQLEALKLLQSSQNHEDRPTL